MCSFTRYESVEDGSRFHTDSMSESLVTTLPAFSTSIERILNSVGVSLIRLSSTKTSAASGSRRMGPARRTLDCRRLQTLTAHTAPT